MVESSPAPRPAADWLSPGRFAALLALFIVAAWPQVILGLQTFVYRDFGYFTWPVAQFQRDCFWRGELPMWNPLNCSGIPFLAQWNTAALYPPALFYLLLPLSWSLGVFQLLHLLLGGVGMFLLARRWTGSAFAAAFAGVAFAFNGLSQNSLMWVSNLAALMWMPWVLWLGERAWREGRKTLVLAALVAATQMLAGAPEIIALTWLLLALLLATAWRLPARWLFGRRFAALALLVAGLCAVQLLPFLDLLAHSHRDEHFPGSSWAMPVSGWANFLLPLFRAHESYHGVFLQNGQGWTSSYYVGVATVALALLAAARRRAWPLAALALLGGWLALGDAGGLYRWLHEHVPGMAFMRYPIKFIVLPVFLLPLLAAFALAENSPTGKTSRKLGAWLGVVAVLAGIVWFAARHPATGEVWPALWRNALARAALFTGIFAGVAMAEKISSREWRTRWQLAVLALLWLDLLTHAPRAKTINADAYSPAQQRDA
ncbi:MAG: hypothetical protein NTZ16_15990, partial [Verrucomicrobia bacterium]|nr:hypothetical protein [Verrucomicrobiota bacterium]